MNPNHYLIHSTNRETKTTMANQNTEEYCLHQYKFDDVGNIIFRGRSFGEQPTAWQVIFIKGTDNVYFRCGQHPLALKFAEENAMRGRFVIPAADAFVSTTTVE